MKTFTHHQLKPYNTFMLPAVCDCFVQIESENEVPQSLADGLFDGNHLILGGGSNVLFVSDFHGTIVQMCTQGIDVLEEDGERVRLSVAAGVSWADFVDYCVSHHYYGVENLIGIPGLVGSCPVQNIGAYGVEVKDVISKVIGYRLASKKAFELTNEECRFDYRSSIFKTDWKNDVLITRVEFVLSKKEHFSISYQGIVKELEENNLPLTIENLAATVKAVRDRKLPDITKIGCAGSFFKNPIVGIDVRDRLLQQIPNLVSYPVGEGSVKLAAGQLIDLAGLKGVRHGDAGVYPHQALVIVNYGNASGTDICDFYRFVQKRVEEKIEILIEPEVNVIGTLD